MADYHTVYKEPEGTTTEWEDLQIKYGNMEPVAKPQVAKWMPAEDDKKGGADDDDLEDDEGDDRFMEEYRRRRIAEIKAASSVPQYGTVELIKGPDFIREVTNASQNVWVVVHLFKDGAASSALLGKCLDELAQKFRATKFVRIVSTDCIPNYPDANLPTLLVYRGGQIKETLTGLQHYGMGKGSKCSPEGVALALCRIGPVLSGPDESEEDVLERVRRDVVLGVVERRDQRGTHEDDEEDDDL